MAVLVVNAGSSSIKAAVFAPDLTERLSARVTEIGGAARLEAGQGAQAIDAPDHAAAMARLFAALALQGVPLSDITLAAHRVVHGGESLTAPCRITPEVEARIDATIPLAPLHNPANLTAIRAVATLAPDLPQYASFDTAFHATNPEPARRYALPERAEALGLRRYGFHGISYASLVARLPELTGAALPERLLALHLGNGASACAILNGRSVATTMGYSPLDGLTMGTRAGSIDGNAVLKLAEAFGIDGAARILNRESGLLGLGGASDMRALHAAGSDRAAFAVDHFIYWAIRHAGSLIAAMGGLDAIAFTGGIGENDAKVRAGIVAGLGYMGAVLESGANEKGLARLQATHSNVAIWKVVAAEEAQIARDAMALHGSRDKGKRDGTA
jgi:acetate kinase